MVGAQPCFGIDDFATQCAPPPRTVAIRAGRLFDSNAGKLVNDQVIVIQGERIVSVGPEAEAQIPAGAASIELPDATVLVLQGIAFLMILASETLYGRFRIFRAERGA